MNKKKILWIGILMVFIIAVIIIIAIAKPKENTKTVEPVKRGDGTQVSQNIENQNNTNSNETDVKYIKKELEDGILYSTTGEKIEADVVLGDNFFDTTIADMMLNPNSYAGKKIEIAGMYMENSPYTFVGRYSTSNLCADCPTGYSYVEYQLKGKIEEKFTDEKEWIKIIGTLEKGLDNVGTERTPIYQPYYYIDVLSLQVMNERGKDTVNN